jgi:hypothetical protein
MNMWEINHPKPPGHPLFHQKWVVFDSLNCLQLGVYPRRSDKYIDATTKVNAAGLTACRIKPGMWQ